MKDFVKPSAAVDFDKLLSLVGSPSLDEGAKAILGGSVYYYCSGADPTPISVFGCKPTVYIYVDLFKVIHREFNTGAAVLYDRIKSLGYALKRRESLSPVERIRSARHAELTEFVGNGGEFYLLYLDADCERAFCELYGESLNYVQPLCVCNYRSEASGATLRRLEKRVAYILGHAFGEKYRPIADYTYLGDYGKDQRVTLYKRAYYYLF